MRGRRLLTVWVGTLAVMFLAVDVVTPFRVDAASPPEQVRTGLGQTVATDLAAPDLSARAWSWPTAPVRVMRPFLAPAHAYGPGHRGLDLAAPPGADVRAPASGVVAFAGSVAGRGVLTIDHGDGLVTTFEPVEATLMAGTPVARGDVVAMAAAGGHAAAGTVHFGVRWYGDYINPLLLLGGIPRAVLLPCC